ncbi:hypothetical protein Aros01_02123 [Streptosporangium roseum]|uniref:Uncharacterized protein n=2 Tax=Streptosporangium roseum TaxID=2001 RepID=D2B339_STRRD|nr:hypothetical protein Sros_2544 [Streptosporangium roseum DSM 43021]
MLHTVLRRRANGESVEAIRLDLIIPTGKREGQHPSLASIYRAPAEHEKRQAYPKAVEQAHADSAMLQARTRSARPTSRIIADQRYPPDFRRRPRLPRHGPQRHR